MGVAATGAEEATFISEGASRFVGGFDTAVEAPFGSVAFRAEDPCGRPAAWDGPGGAASGPLAAGWGAAACGGGGLGAVAAAGETAGDVSLRCCAAGGCEGITAAQALKAMSSGRQP